MRFDLRKRRTNIEDQRFFVQIATDVKTNPHKYIEAGKWLDEYFPKNDFWKEKLEPELTNFRVVKGQDKFNKYLKRGDILEILQQAKDNSEIQKPYFQIKVDIDDKWLSSNFLVKPYEKLLKHYTNQIFISMADSKRIILLTWLVTDQDAENANINVTKFEKWPWGFNFSNDNPWYRYRSHASARIFSTYPETWMEIVHTAWVKIESENTAETEHRVGSDNIGDGQESGKNLKEPVSPRAKNIFDKLKSLSPLEAMKTEQLLDWLSEEYNDTIDDGTLRRALTELKPYGVYNKKRIGYCIKQ